MIGALSLGSFEFYQRYSGDVNTGIRNPAVQTPLSSLAESDSNSDLISALSQVDGRGESMSDGTGISTTASSSPNRTSTSPSSRTVAIFLRAFQDTLSNIFNTASSNQAVAPRDENDIDFDSLHDSIAPDFQSNSSTFVTVMPPKDVWQRQF